MRPRTLLILLLIVAAGGAFVWFVERDLPTTEEREARKNRVLDLEAQDEVDRVEIAFEDRRVVLERVGGEEDEETAGEWRIVEPMTARADASAVGNLVRSLSELDATRTLDEVGDRGEYGLDPARLSVTLRAGETSSTIRFGDELPASTLRAATTADDDAVRVVEGSVFDLATREPGEWRDPSLFPGERRDVERIRIGSGEGSLLLARRGERFWVESPFADAADTERVDELLASLTGLRAEAFVDDPAAVPDAEAIASRFEVTVRDRAEPVEVVVGPVTEGASAGDGPDETSEAAEGPEEPPVRLVRVGDQWAEARTDLESFPGLEPRSWRSPALTAWPGYDIDTIRIAGGGEELVLTREGADWRRGEDRILYSAASDLLAAITRFRARDVEPAAGAPGGTVDLELEITHKEGAEETFRIWRTEEGALVIPGGRDVGLRAAPETLASLDAAIEDVRNAEPLPETPDAPDEAGSEE